MQTAHPVLLGNSFPFSLIRRRVVVTPAGRDEIRKVLAERSFFSFWGHANTIRAANDFFGLDVTPTSERPVIGLDAGHYPVAEGRVFRECWLLSPDYVAGFRPQVGEQVGEDKIIGWQVLRLLWE